MPAQSPRAASPRTQRKRPGDLTGTRSQKMAADVAKQREQDAKDDTAAVAAERAEKLATTVSFVPRTADDVELEDEVEEDVEVEVRPKTEFIRVNFPIESMTYGREVLNPGDWDEENARWAKAPVLGNLQTYDFEEGVRYEVSADMADHLRSLGYVYEY